MKKLNQRGNLCIFMFGRFVMIFIDTLTIKSGISIHNKQI